MTDNTNNLEAAIRDLDNRMAQLGRESVNVARPKLAIALVQAAHDGIIDENDTEARYDAYLAAREKKQGQSKLAQGVDDGNGKKANLSKCRQLVRMAMLPTVDGPDMLNRTTEARIAALNGEDKIEAPFDAFVKVARTQIAKTGDGGGMLTDEEIADCVKKSVAAEKDTLDKLIDAYKRAHKLNRDMEAAGVETQYTSAAMEAYRQAIAEMGGEAPAITKEEKEMAAFMAKAERMGLTLNS